MTLPTVMFYCQHSLGIGHLRRSLAIADALTCDFRVVFLNGGRFPTTVPRPPGIEFIDLPPLGMGADGVLVSRGDAHDVTEARAIRKRRVLDAFRRVRPQVLLIELFPFGRKKFAFELLPLLRLARASEPKPLTVCSLRDILVDERKDQQRFDDRARWVTDRWFDAVLIHTDPCFARLEESFRPRQALTTPVLYTGFVVPETAAEPPAIEPGLVVSAGGGQVGASLLGTAVEASRAIRERFGLSMTVVAGPFLPEPEWRALQSIASGKDGLTLLRSVPCLEVLLRGARASISQCGYNTVMDLLRTGTPALLVPYCGRQENEQTRRAEKLAALGAARVLPEKLLSVRHLVSESGRLLRFTPKPPVLKMNGAAVTREMLVDMLDRQRTNRDGVHGRVA